MCRKANVAPIAPIPASTAPATLPYARKVRAPTTRADTRAARISSASRWLSGGGVGLLMRSLRCCAASHVTTGATRRQGGNGRSARRLAHEVDRDQEQGHLDDHGDDEDPRRRRGGSP